MKIKSLYEIPAVAAYLKRIGAEPRSLRTAVVRENKGAYWDDIAVISIESTGIVKAPANYAPTEKEKLAIEVDCQSVQWPQMKMLKTLVDMPSELKDIPAENRFEFRNKNNEIIMLQTRVDLGGGEKRYVPWTYWDDNQWRKMEPEGPLPIWGTDMTPQEHSAPLRLPSSFCFEFFCES